MEVEENFVVFKFSDDNNWKYKGVFSGILDNNFIESPVGFDFITEALFMLWVNEKGDWICKGRMKFPSGNKVVVEHNLGQNSSEEEFLKYVNKVPMTHQFYAPNPSGTLEDLIELMKKNDLIDHMRTIEKKT